jgi:hypothetical protein
LAFDAIFPRLSLILSPIASVVGSRSLEAPIAVKIAIIVSESIINAEACLEGR